MRVIAILAIAALVVLLLATLGVTLMIYPAVWSSVRDSWRRIPAGGRPRALAGGASVFFLLAIIAVLLLLEPWGGHTIVWVVLGFTGVLAAWGLVTAWAQGRRASRRARRSRAPSSSSR